MNAPLTYIVGEFLLSVVAITLVVSVYIVSFGMIGLNAVSRTYGVRDVSVSPKPDDVLAAQVILVLLSNTC